MAAPAPTAPPAPPVTSLSGTLPGEAASPTGTPTSLEQSLTVSPLESEMAAAGTVSTVDALIRAVGITALAMVALRLERVFTKPARDQLRASRRRIATAG